MPGAVRVDPRVPGRASPVTASEAAGGPERVVEQYDTLVELEAALVVRECAGWHLLSTGLVRPGRWWAEYELDPHAG
ncbi:MAG: hypothetical protein JWO60_3098 [Frankiales bacterium]|jgi:hypothetical protein|nr:hypothetical protein [Frankiales bacterium]